MAAILPPALDEVTRRYLEGLMKWLCRCPQTPVEAITEHLQAVLSSFVRKPELASLSASIVGQIGRDVCTEVIALTPLVSLRPEDPSTRQPQASAAPPISRRPSASPTPTADDFVSSPATFELTRGLSAPNEIVLRGIHVSVAGRPLIENSSITLCRGRRYGLVGRNGTGKSSFLRALSRRELDGLPPEVSIFHVEQQVLGLAIGALDCVLAGDSTRSRLLARQTWLREKLNDAACEESRVATMYAKELREVDAELIEMDASGSPLRASRILRGLGFRGELSEPTATATIDHAPPTMFLPTCNLSGGWRMRVALARALFCRPDVLLLDEPTNMLDLRSTLWLAHYLETQCADLTVVLVSHDRGFLDRVLTDVILLKARCLKPFHGGFTQFQRVMVERAKHSVRVAEARKLHQDHIRHFIERFRSNAKRASLVQSRIKRLTKLESEDGHDATLVDDASVLFKFPDCEGLLPQPLIRLEQAGIGIQGQTLLSDVSIAIDQDARVGIVGDNGSGKSTLLNAIAGNTQGGSTVLAGLRAAHPKLRIGHFTQHHVDGLDFDQSPTEFLVMSATEGQISAQDARAWLASFGIARATALQPISSLSGGEKSRVLLAAIAHRQPHVLLLDEPDNHLDLDSVQALVDAINTYLGAVVVITHNQQVLQQCCDDLWVVGDGKAERWDSQEDYHHFVRRRLKETEA